MYILPRLRTSSVEFRFGLEANDVKMHSAYIITEHVATINVASAEALSH